MDDPTTVATGVDEGGLVKEFFQLIMPKLYAQACVPMETEGQQWYWFAAPTEERLKVAYQWS
jgi:hypothetical protein